MGRGGAGTWPRYWPGFDLAFFGKGIIWEKVENSHFCHHTSLSTDSWSELQPQDSWALTCWTLVSTVWKWRWKEFSRVPLLGTPWTVSHQALLSVEFPQARIVGCHFLLQGSSWPRDWTQVSRIAGRFFTVWVCTAYLHQIYPGH